jgi:sarcosine oxidase subunit beta
MAKRGSEMKKIITPTAEDFPKTADAVVIGGGIVGTATAFWLSKAGLNVILVEMRQGLSTLTTPNSVECFRAQFTEPELSRLAQTSLDIFESFSDLVSLPDIDIGLNYQGYLFYTDDAGQIKSLRDSVKAHHALGVLDSEFLDRTALLKRFPFLGASVQGATFRQKDGWLSSHELTHGFASGSQATFLLETKAKGITLDNQGVSGVITNHGTISTRYVINAAGPYASEIGKMVGLDLPLRPVRRQKAYISPRPNIPQNAPMTIDLTRDVYFRPETGGALIGWVDPDEPESPASENLPTDRFFAAKTMALLSETIPFWEEVAQSLKSTDVITSAGQYVYTPDDQPLIGEWDEIPGFYLNCGYWAGVMLAPAAGQRIADLINGNMKPEDNLLRPTRYAEGIVLEGSSFLRGKH